MSSTDSFERMAKLHRALADEWEALARNKRAEQTGSAAPVKPPNKRGKVVRRKGVVPDELAMKDAAEALRELGIEVK